jgi:RNA polymerase sigma-70 factor, ECF subfamily
MTADLTKTLADRALVARARDGEEIAVHLVVSAVRAIALRYSRARLSTYAGGAEVAEDVAQEVSLAVVDLLPRYTDQGAPFAALVFAVAANKVADAQRRFGRTPVQVVDELPDRAEPSLGPEQQLMVRSDVETALALLDRLPERMARVVRMRAEGLSAEEVGQVLGMTANAVRVSQHRGLARLREMIAASEDHRERFAERRNVAAAA